MVLSSVFFKEILTNDKGGHGHMSASAKGNLKSSIVRDISK